jgi:hypothetical protein
MLHNTKRELDVPSPTRETRDDLSQASPGMCQSPRPGRTLPTGAARQATRPPISWNHARRAGFLAHSSLRLQAAVVVLLLGAGAIGCGGATQPSGAAKLYFSVQPSNATAGVAIAPAVVIQDASGNTVTSATSAVTVAIRANPGGGTLSGTTTVNPVNGVASFPGLSIDKAGAGYTLVASSIPLTSATSAAFTITPAAVARLAFIGQPSSGTAGVALAPAVGVAIQDAFGNTVPNATNAVIVALGTNPTGGTLSGSTTMNAVNGVASFSGLLIDKAGSGYMLVASSIPLTSTTSAAFAIAPGPVMSMWVTPGAAVLTFPSGSNVVQLYAIAADAYGNLVPVNATWSSADPTVATVDATGLVVGNGGATTISASAAGRVGTAAIVVECIPPRCVLPVDGSFSQQPTAARAGATISPPVQVTLSPAWTGFATIAIGNNPTGGTLTPITAPTLNNSTLATWSNLSIAKPGSGYTLVVFIHNPGGGIASGITSAPFDIAP